MGDNLSGIKKRSQAGLARSASGIVLLFLAAVGAGLPAARQGGPTDGTDRAEAFEVGPSELEKLPSGKEADGIAGDFVLRNAHLEALVSGNLPGRKANMTTNYRNPTPGCLYDLAVRGAGDQLTCLAPGGLEGPVSSVRVAADGSDPGSPEAVVRVERTAALGEGIEEVHEYRLAPNWRHLLIVSSYRNRRSRPAQVKPAAVWKGLSGELEAAGLRAGDAMDPLDRQGYAVGPVPWPKAEATGAPLDLAPGERRSVAVAVAPARSPAEALGVVAALRGPTGILRGSVRDREGRGIPSAAIEIPMGLTAKGEKKILPLYPDPSGGFEARLLPGEYDLSVRDLGRPDLGRKVTVPDGGEAQAEFEMARESRVVFDVSGPNGVNLPVKAQFIGLDPTRDPVLGPNIRARGCKNQYHSETGWFTVAVPPGKYRVVVTRGMEYDHHQEELTLEAGREARVSATLKRVVDTRGWVSTDFHSHSTPSGDNYCGTDDRLVNLAAEGVEFAPTTEHNRFYDWAPHLARLGLQEEIATAVGIELTGPGAHFNSFPQRVVPGAQDGGAPGWSRDPRINAIVLRDWAGGGPERWVQINHPSVGEFFRDRNADGIPDGGFPDLERYIDAAEVWSAEILNHSPILSTVDLTTGKPRRFQNRTFAWLQLLNQGRRMWCVAVSDAHEVYNGGTGGWRTYVPSSTDLPDRIDLREIVRNARAGRMVVSNGPFLEAALLDGTPPGGATVAAGPVQLRVRVETNTWVDVDRLQVLVNGRPRPDLNFTRATHPDLFQRAQGGGIRLERVIEVPLSEDSHLIAVAFGEGSDLRTGFGTSWQATMHPCAFHNPIYVDVDGGGFRPNGDTLGHPLSVAFPLRRSF